MRGIIIFCGLILSQALQAQVSEYLGDEKALYAATKQVNQFFHRFNGEEDLKGNRYYEKDQFYRNPELRSKYIKVLFNNKNQEISLASKQNFLRDVNDGTKPKYLDFHGGNWFAEVHAKFDYKGKDETVVLFLKLQEENVGSKWVIFKAYFDPFRKYFEVDTTTAKKFIHPMSHEVAFMNLKKIFKDPQIAAAYAAQDFQPDHLSLVLYEIKQSNLTFKTVGQVKFHFFQLDNWYFELSEYNRPGYNTGWLISDLVKVSPEQRDQLMKFIYYEGL
ncbi:MAG: hypothetical protein OER04_00685 [Cyclobacteriaceae bacterium]|nr:hypothetical protein [Cyclobacteriaceae bacterium]